MFNNELWQKPAGGGGGAFYTHQIANSERFDKASASYMTMDPNVGDRKTWAVSCWVKRTGLGNGSVGNNSLIASDNGASGGAYSSMITFNNTDQISISTGTTIELVTVAKFRDTSAFYHIVVSANTTDSTEGNRWRIYINGVNQVVTGTYPSQNYDFTMWGNGASIWIGKQGASAYTVFSNFDISEVAMTEGTAHNADTFGELKNGVWIPKDLSGVTFGDEGFWLQMKNSAVGSGSSSTVGADTSGNANHFTTTNLATSDHLLSSPTFNSDSNGGNFATYNPLTPVGLSMDLMALSEGNLHVQSENNDKYSQAIGNMGVRTGKWYLEFYIKAAGYPSWAVGWHSGSQLGRYDGDVEAANANLAYVGYFTGSDVYLHTFGNTDTGSPRPATSGWTAAGTAPTTGDVIICAMDFDAGKGWWGMNGQWGNVGAGTGNPATGANASITWTVANYADYKFPHTLSWANPDAELMMNAGQDGTFAGNISAGGNADDTGYGNFKYDVPAGFLALCTGNLPVSEDVDPAETSDNFPQKLFNPYIYTGNATDNRNLTGMGFQPDWCWIKDRNSDEGHQVYDSSRGVEKRIQTNTAGAEEATSDKFQAFLSDGFQVGASNDTNKNASGFVNWSWKINGGTTVTNTAGSIDTTVQVNAAAGISIVQWAGGGGAATFGHGLGVAPSFVTAKSRTASAALMDWPAMHKNMGATGAFPGDNTRMYFNSPDEFGGGTLWIPSQNSTTVFGVSGANINDSGKSYVAYCFAEVEGYSKFGHYEGNGNASGAFVYLGFSPALVICKSSDSGSDWQMFDNKRLGHNVNNNEIQGNDSTAEATTDMIDLLSNGFKHRIATDPNVAESYIYLAWATNPLKYATAR